MRAVLVLVLALLATPTLAASTARVTGGDINVRSGPGSRYAVIDSLPNGTEVMLERCTRSGRWCLVADTGWVNASYLVGWSAKTRATPPRSIGPKLFPGSGIFGD
ncbi:SH3 domain-containing protein [uncultured Devosia sp.]|uniref:SH3 domain-containing protein n=1 Tax=uncultured Devosia sp. TaxID=211434 RepID=UPI0035C9E849